MVFNMAWSPSKAILVVGGTALAGVTIAATGGLAKLIDRHANSKK